MQYNRTLLAIGAQNFAFPYWNSPKWFDEYFNKTFILAPQQKLWNIKREKNNSQNNINFGLHLRIKLQSVVFEGLDFLLYLPTVRYRGCRFFYPQLSKILCLSLGLLSIIFFLQNLEQNGVYLFLHLTLTTKYLFSSLFFVNVTCIVVYSNSESAWTGYLWFKKLGWDFVLNLLQRIRLEIFLPNVQ